MLVARMCPASDKVRFFKGDNGKNFAMAPSLEITPFTTEK